MKQKTIKTDKATLFVVELPEGAKFIRIETNQAVVPYGQEVNYEVPGTKESYGYEETEGFSLPEGNWQLLGRLPDTTEEQADKIVDEYIYNTGEIYGYYDYENDTQTDCPIESLYSLLQANEIYFENPTPTFKERFEDFKEAQSKVWDKECCYILTKVGKNEPIQVFV